MWFVNDTAVIDIIDIIAIGYWYYCFAINDISVIGYWYYVIAYR